MVTMWISEMDNWTEERTHRQNGKYSVLAPSDHFYLIICPNFKDANTNVSGWERKKCKADNLKL